MKAKQINHLYWRAGFGLKPQELNVLSSKKKSQVVKELLQTSLSDTSFTFPLKEFQFLTKEEFDRKEETRREYVKKSRKMIGNLNVKWIQFMAETPQVLKEKMTLFWTNHFSCQDQMITYMYRYNQTIRTHALGDFGALVKAISKEPAMIRYLDLNKNKKKRPNENFARELMELFTLGVGHYTEEDIKESAKAFTGYQTTFEGDFVLNLKQHDDGFKHFFGKSGKYDGDDIIDIILEQKVCAQFICEKIYRYFVNEQINPKHVGEMVEVFYPNYNIADLMQMVFTSHWFYAEENLGVKVKSPIDLLVGMQKVVPYQMKKKKQMFRLQHVLGQKLFYPPNVAGWDEGLGWINTNTLMVRLNLPVLLLKSGEGSKSEKGYLGRGFLTTTHWDDFTQNYAPLTNEALRDHLFLAPLNKGTESYLKLREKTTQEVYVLELMSLPEYQMC